jgi:hypothetical protein
VRGHSQRCQRFLGNANSHPHRHLAPKTPADPTTIVERHLLTAGEKLSNIQLPVSAGYALADRGIALRLNSKLANYLRLNSLGWQRLQSDQVTGRTGFGGGAVRFSRDELPMLQCNLLEGLYVAEKREGLISVKPTSGWTIQCNVTYLFCCGGQSQMRLIDLHCVQTGL